MELRRKEYLTFNDGRKICLTYDWDVLMKYFRISGQDPKEWENAPFNPKSFFILAWICAVAGEECEGRDLNMTALEFRRLLVKSGPSTLKQLLKAFVMLSADELDPEFMKSKIQSQQLN